jgi:membrane protein implicated in regulation of membrane protease activity
MLRRSLLTIGALVLILGLAALASGVMDRSIVFILWGLFLIAAIVFERFRYKRLERKRPGPGWERTTERFVDDETGETVTVYVEPKTGERSYVRE